MRYQECQIHRQKIEWRWPGPGMGGRGELLFNVSGCRASVGEDENILGVKLVVMVAPPSDKYLMSFNCTFYSDFFCFSFLGMHPRHMEVPRLGVESELQLPAYTTATATQDPSHACDLHHSSWQCRTLNPPSEATLMNPHPHGYQSDLFLLCHNGNSRAVYFKMVKNITNVYVMHTSHCMYFMYILGHILPQ